MLRDLKLKSVYKSDQDNILEDFYFPTLSVAASYDRAVGFFSASTINYAAQALSIFIRNRGRIRLVLGAFADARDIEAVSEGLRQREIAEKVGKQFISGIESVNDTLFQNRFESLAWLVAHERLEIKIALRVQGMYHDKVGIISDATGDSVVFAGSANESAQALVPIFNSESISVFPSWRPELDSFFRPHKDSFARLWENKSRNTAVIDLPTAIHERLLSVARSLDEEPDPDRELDMARRLRTHLFTGDDQVRDRSPRLPDTIDGNPLEIRQHQRDALNAWRSKGGFQGIFDLATGSGKTVTAIYAIVQMAKQIPGLTAVIAAPYQSLADQWCDILEQFNIRPIRCYVSKTNWLEELRSTVHDVVMGTCAFAAIVVVNKTLKSIEFQSAVAQLPARQFLWIGDECHHHASQGLAAALPQNAQYRIGLSATPEHYLDEDRNQRLHYYYGDVVYSYSLEQAIADKVLSPYQYFPHIVELTESEAIDFIKLSNEIARLFSKSPKGQELGSNQTLSALLLRRARIVASASNKLRELDNVLKVRQPASHTLFYCGDGKMSSAEIEDDEDNDEQDQDSILGGRQVEVISQMLDNLGWRLSRFTAHESRRDRQDILSNFRFGLIDALVAIKCLDEGIDVPACDTAFMLASSRDPRQFIQRRGRILRRSPGKTSATIFDFVVVLPQGIEDELGHAKKLIASELKRVAEFSGLATNRHTAYQTLRPVLQDYNLEHAI